MFNRTKKKSNLKNFFGEDEHDKEDLSNFEPAVKKKVKGNIKYNTAKITEDYKQAVDELTSDLQYKSKPELIGKTNDSAFHYNEIDTDFTQDAKAIALKNIQISQDIKAGKVSSKYYKGLNGYAEYNEKSENSIRSSKFTGSLGPIRAPKHIRVTCRFDYNPSLCKDWHDTGSCVFGDSCIYIHDRGDYKSGWELEKEWEEEQKKKAKNNGHVSDIESDNAADDLVIPETCPICNGPFSQTVITNCEHFFCEKCALANYAKSGNCFVCNRPTNGTFNDGVKVLRKMKEVKETLEKEKAATKGKKKKVTESALVEIEGAEMDESEKKKLLEGIEFNEAEAEEEELKGLAGEFKRKRAKQKSQIKYESDWLL